MTTETDKKQSKSYMTMSSGMNYRDIAAAMTEAGYPIHCTSSRAQSLQGACEIVQNLSENLLGKTIEQDEAMELVKQPGTVEAMSDLLCVAWKQLKAERDAGQ